MDVPETPEPQPTSAAEQLAPGAPALSTSQDAGPAPAAQAGVPEDLRVPWDGVDMGLFFIFGLCSAVVVAQLLQLAFALLFALQPEQIRSMATLNTAFAVTHQVAWSLLMLAFLWLVTEVRCRTPFWKALRFRLFRVADMSAAGTVVTFLAGGAMLAIAVQLLSLSLRTPARLPIEALFRTRESIYMMMVAGIMVAPLVEEVMFRGFLYPIVARRLGVRAGVGLTGLLFGMMHAMQLWGGWGQIALLVCVGIVLTYARARTGTLLASYLLHLGYNSLLLLGFYVATGGLENLPAPR